MGYAIVGFGAGAAQQCQGSEVSEDGLGNYGDFCCKVATWSAATYKNVKGNNSWRRWREKVLRLALGNILTPSDMGLPTKIHQIAYNAGLNEKAAVSQELLTKTSTAYNNFLTLFPPDRWYKKQNCKRGDYDDGVCTGGEKTLSCWKSNYPPHTAQMAALLSSVVGTTITVQHLNNIGEWDQPPIIMTSRDKVKEQVPKAFMDWLLSVYSQWKNMPEALNGRKGGNGYVPPPEKFFVAEGGVVKPTPWMAWFIDAMSPKGVKIQIAPAAMRAVAQPKPKATISKAALQRQVVQAPSSTEETPPPVPPEQPLPPVPEAEGIDPKTLAIGGVAVVALGFGAFVLLKKK